MSAGTRRRLRAIRFVDSIRFRVALAATLLFTLAISLGANLLARQWGQTLREQTALELSHTIDDILANQAAGLPVYKISFVPSSSLYFRMDLSDGTTQEGFVRPANRDEPQPRQSDRVDEVDGVLVEAASSYPVGGESQLLLERTFNDEDGLGRVSVVAPIGSISSAQQSLIVLMAYGVPVLVLFTAGLLWLVTSRALRPVDTLCTRAEEISFSNLEGELPVPVHDDEIARLTRHLNRMLDRLRDARNRQRQFVSDASHELRSPVATILALTESGMLHPDVTDWPATAAQVQREATRLAGLIQDMLDLARLQEGMPVRRDRVDLSELLMEDAERILAPAERRGLTVDTTAVSTVFAAGDWDRLVHAVRNLTDNAVRHATTTVRLEAVLDGGEAVVRVCDDGAGVPVEDRERIFERFTRLDEGRDRDAGGAGIGLPLALAVALAHGGSLHVEDSPLGGACFVLRLPRSPN